MCGEAIDTKLFANNSRVNKSVLHPIFIDVKENRARMKNRNHLSKVQGGYSLARILGKTDITRYQKMQKPSKSKTRDKLPDLSVKERIQFKPLQIQRASTSSRREPSKPSTRDKSPDLSLGERSQAKSPQVQRTSTSGTRAIPSRTSTNVYDQTIVINEQAKTYRSVLLSSPPSLSIPDKRLVIDDEFYQPKPSVFKRFGPSTASIQEHNHVSHKRSNLEPIRPAKRPSVDTSDGLFLEPKVRKQSAIRVTYIPINKNIAKADTHLLTITSSLLEVTNKPLQSNKQTQQNNKSIIASENSQRRVGNAFHNHSPSTRVQSTGGSAAVTNINKTQLFKLTPVLPPTKNKVVNLKSCSLWDTSNTDPKQHSPLHPVPIKPYP